MNRYEEQNYQVFKNYLKAHLLSPQSRCGKSSLELQITSVCNTKCSYCYYKNFGEQLYPRSLCSDPNLILDNIRKVIEWDKQNNYQFSCIEIFSGEFFWFPRYREVLNYLLENTPYRIVIPTNGTFALTDEKTKEICDLLDVHRNRIMLSLSIDGKYLDNETRSIRSGSQYTDEFYDRLFKFTNKYNYGFHPMVGAKGIEKWIDNMEWFLENIQKYYNISRKDAFDLVYLLEVRNPDWRPEELGHLRKFIEYLIDISYKEYGNPIDYFNQFIKKGALNIFTNVTHSIGRGLGCSIQHCFYVRCGDLSLVPCHRTSYDGFTAGKLKFNGSDFDVEPENPEMFMMINSIDAKQGVMCLDCPISALCSLPCLGCNFEVNHDPFIPVKSVCNLEFVIVRTVVEKLIEYNVFNLVLNEWPEHSTKHHQLKMLKERL